MANFFLPAALWTWLVQWFTNCADGLLEAAAVLSERTCEWLTVVTDASLLIVLWLCLTTLLKVLIITFPRGLMAMPQRKIWRGPTRCVSSPHSCFEFIIFVLLSPSYFICRKIPVAKNILNEWCVSKEWSGESEDQDRSSVKTYNDTEKLLNSLSLVSSF